MWCLARHDGPAGAELDFNKTVERDACAPKLGAHSVFFSLNLHAFVVGADRHSNMSRLPNATKTELGTGRGRASTRTTRNPPTRDTPCHDGPERLTSRCSCGRAGAAQAYKRCVVGRRGSGHVRTAGASAARAPRRTGRWRVSVGDGAPGPTWTLARHLFRVSAAADATAICLIMGYDSSALEKDGLV